MPRVIEGTITDPGGRFAVVASRFNEFITTRLVEGCMDALKRHDIDVEERVDLIWVPGSWELPFMCRKAAASGRYVAVVALGAVIRGGTPHFDYVAAEVAKGVALASLETNMPVVFGVLTTDTIEQAVERAGTKAGNKGFDAGLAAIELASLVKAFGG